jgi:hypothetical protein
MRLADRWPIIPVRPRPRRLAMGLVLSVAASGCGGSGEGGVHLDKPPDSKSIGLPVRSSPPPTRKPAGSSRKKADQFLPG